MPWSGSAGSKTYARTDGTRSGSTTWQLADGAGVDIIATDHDTHDQDMADAISSTLLKDGGNTATANLPMGGFRHTNVAVAAARSDYARFSDHQDQKGVYCPTVGGTANAITLTTGYTATVYAAGQRFSFIVGTTNSGAATVDVDGIGAKSLVRADGSNTALVASDIRAGMIAEIQYDGTRFQLLSSQFMSAASADVLARIVKVGSVAIWPMTTVPSGWLEADGSAVSRTTYAELFTAYGTAYGTGDGSTTFNLPNYKDTFLRGFDAAGTDASSRTDRGDGTTGASVGTKQTFTVERHLHANTAATTVANGTNILSGTSNNVNQSGANNTSPDANTIVRVTITAATAMTNANYPASGGNETRPKNTTVKFIILALPAAASAATLGVNGFLYQWDTGTTDADPGTGKLRVNNATLASVTKLYISETGADGADYTSALGVWDDSSSGTKGTLYLYKVGQPSTYAYFKISGTLTDGGSYRKFDITYGGSNGTLASGDNLSVLFVPTGDGATGALAYQGSWDASSGAFPGGGNANIGWYYRVSVAGTVNSISFSVGDGIYALANSASTSTYASNWQRVEGVMTSAEVLAALEGSNVVINEAGASLDFRVEGDTEQNLIFADGSADLVGFGTASPAARVHSLVADAARAGLFAGATTAVRIVPTTVGTWLEGIDPTGTLTYNPLLVGGSRLGIVLSGSEIGRWDSTGFAIGHAAAKNKLDVVGSIGFGAPVTKTGDFTLAATENDIINNKSGSACVATLPTASTWTGRRVRIKTIQAQAVNSAGSNVCPIDTATPGTAILAGTAGKWAELVSDGTNWVIMASN